MFHTFFDPKLKPSFATKNGRPTISSLRDRLLFIQKLTVKPQQLDFVAQLFLALNRKQRFDSFQRACSVFRHFSGWIYILICFVYKSQIYL